METFYFTKKYKEGYWGCKKEEKIEVLLPSRYAINTYASYLYNCDRKIKEILITDKNDNFILLYKEDEIKWTIN